MSENLVRQKFSRHIDIQRYFVREVVLARFLRFVPLRTHKTMADVYTKSLPSPAFVAHRQIMIGHVSFAARLLPALCRGLFLSAAFSYFSICSGISLEMTLKLQMQKPLLLWLRRVSLA